MESEFALFGIVHLVILGVILVAAAGLARYSLGNSQRGRLVRWILGGVLLTNELLSYLYRFHQGWIDFPYGLPLHLCNAGIWLTVVALFTLRSWAVDVAYYWTLAGTSMAVVTPDLHVSVGSIAGIQYFLSHGGAVTAVLTLIWSKQARPRAGSVWKVLGITAAAAVGVGIFNLVYGTNYMYLCAKPLRPSLLDLLGPWPVYLLGGLAVASLLFMLLWLPFRTWGASGHTPQD